VHWSEPEWVRVATAAASLVQIEAPPTDDPQGLKPNLNETSLRGPEGPLFHGASTDSSLNKKRFAQDDSALSLGEKIENAPWLVMNASVSRMWFLAEPVGVQRRLVKAISDEAGIPLEFKHIEEILRFAEENSTTGKERSLPNGWKLRRESDELVFLTPDLRQPANGEVHQAASSGDYEYELAVPGQLSVCEAGVMIEVRRIPAQSRAEYNAAHLLDAGSLPGPLRVRNWRPGDRFWPAHTKSPKKIKELLQERHLVQVERRLWPVIVSGDGESGEEIIWVRGFPGSRKFAARPGCEAILIVERLLRDES